MKKVTLRKSALAIAVFTALSARAGEGGAADIDIAMAPVEGGYLLNVGLPSAALTEGVTVIQEGEVSQCSESELVCVLDTPYKRGRMISATIELPNFDVDNPACREVSFESLTPLGWRQEATLQSAEVITDDEGAYLQIAGLGQKWAYKPLVITGSFVFEGGSACILEPEEEEEEGAVIGHADCEAEGRYENVLKNANLQIVDCTFYHADGSPAGNHRPTQHLHYTAVQSQDIESGPLRLTCLTNGEGLASCNLVVDPAAVWGEGNYHISDDADLGKQVDQTYLISGSAYLPDYVVPLEQTFSIHFK